MFYACVGESTLSIVERFGKFNRIAHPGFNCVCCCLGDVVSKTLSLRIQQLEVGCDTKTMDDVFVQLQVCVQYQVIEASILDAAYKLTNSQAQIRSYVFDHVRAKIPRMNLDDVFTAKEEIASSVQEELSKAMGGYGYRIVQALVTDITPDVKVRNAMNEINAATRMRMAAVQKAEAAKVAVITAAQADSESKYLQGQGIARQRQAIINGLRESVVAFQDEIRDVDSRDVIEMMMVTQFFDTIKDIGAHGKNSTIFIPHTPGAVGDLTSQIRSGFMQSQAARVAR